MKIFTILFVLILGISAVSGIKAQEPTPTPVLPRVTAIPAPIPPSIIRLGSGQNIEFQFWVFNDNALIPAKDVVFAAALPPGLTFVSASATGNGTCNYADGIVTCNLGTVEKNPYDYSAIIKIRCTPTIAGTVSLTGTIKGSNTLESTFGDAKTVYPIKSRIRVRFF